MLSAQCIELVWSVESDNGHWPLVRKSDGVRICHREELEREGYEQEIERIKAFPLVCDSVTDLKALHIKKEVERGRAPYSSHNTRAEVELPEVLSMPKASFQIDDAV